MNTYDQKLARTLVLDELFDLTLYKKLRTFSTGGLSIMLDALIPIEMGHLTFWQKFFGIQVHTLNFSRKCKLYILLALCRIFGEPAVHLVLEAIEVNGIKKYLDVWEFYKDDPLGNAVKGILIDEFKHEDVVITRRIEQKIHPERIRNIFFGLNDGLVEMLGAVSGFYAAFQTATPILVASFTVAVAGSFSMAAGAYVALGSEQEVEATTFRKKQFLGEGISRTYQEQPFSSAMLVGIFYLLGAMVPILPVFFGAQNLIISILAAGILLIVVSYLLAFLSGMNIRRRILINLVIVAIAVSVTYGIGLFAANIFGITI